MIMITERLPSITGLYQCFTFVDKREGFILESHTFPFVGFTRQIAREIRGESDSFDPKKFQVQQSTVLVAQERPKRGNETFVAVSAPIRGRNVAFPRGSGVCRLGRLGVKNVN